MKVFHNPKLKVIDYLDERFYTYDGLKFYPSSTTILGVYPKGYGFNEWLKKLGFNADEELRKAGEQGTKIHNSIDLYLNGGQLRWVQEDGTPNYTIDEWKMLNRFVEFENTFKPQTLAQELSLLDEELGYGGTIDRVCVINGEVWMIDYKSSKYIWKSHYLQVSSYIALWNRMYPEYKIQRWGLMHLRSATKGPSKTGSIQGRGWKIEEAPKERTWHDYYRTFDHTKAIWNEENPNYVPKNETFPDFLQIKNHVKLTEDKTVQKVDVGTDFVGGSPVHPVEPAKTPEKETPAIDFEQKIEANAKVQPKASIRVSETLKKTPQDWGQPKPKETPSAKPLPVVDDRVEIN